MGMKLSIIDLSCNKCGGPLHVPLGTAYVTCGHCGSSLQVHSSGGAFYTSLLERIGAQTSAIADDVKAIRANGEIERLDEEWEKTHAEYKQELESAHLGAAAFVGLIGIFFITMMLIFDYANSHEPGKFLCAVAVATLDAVLLGLLIRAGVRRYRSISKVYNQAWKDYQLKRRHWEKRGEFSTGLL